MSQWAGLLGTRGCEEQEAKSCAGSAIDAEQLAKLEVGVFQIFKAFSKAEW